MKAGVMGRDEMGRTVEDWEEGSDRGWKGCGR